MKKKLIENKAIIIIVASMVLLASGTVMIFINNEESNVLSNQNTVDEDIEDTQNTENINEPIDDLNPNINEGITGDKEVGDLKFTNTSLVSNESGAVFTTLVQNTSDEDINVRVFNIIIKDKEGNTMATLDGYVGGIIPANGSREIISNIDMNLEEATNIEYYLID